MAISTRLRLFHLFHFSRPASDRAIYQVVYRRRVQRIVELGVGRGQRALRLIDVARRHFPASEISYTGIDPFEARRAEDGPGLTLKEAYRLLHVTGARVRLVPGNPWSVSSTAVNSLGVADLVLVDWPLDRQHLPRVMFFLERMLHDASLVLLKERIQAGTAEAIKARESVKVLSLERIRALAATFRKAA